MTKLPIIVPITDMRQDAASVLERTRKANEPVIITQRGRAAAILLSVEAYEASENEKHLLQALLQGEKEIAAGIGADLDDVLAEADELLSRK